MRKYEERGGSEDVSKLRCGICINLVTVFKELAESYKIFCDTI